MNELKALWKKLRSRECENTKLVDTFWQEIETKHTNKERFYHTLHHLEYMLNLAMRFESFLNDSDTLIFSIFYHDIIYNPQFQDNEEQSAAIARDRLSQLGVSSDKITKCQEQILATKSHKAGSDSDTNYLLDFDLAILGDSLENYKAYSKNIRAEYAMYSDKHYKEGRKKVLHHFLKMDSIFKTTEFQKNREQRARENLEYELGEL